MTNGLIQHIIAAESTSIQWVKRVLAVSLILHKEDIIDTCSPFVIFNMQHFLFHKSRTKSHQRMGSQSILSTGVPVYLAPWTGCPPGGKPTMVGLPPGGNLSRDILPPTLVTFTPGGQHIPAGLSCPPGVKLNQPGYLAPHPWTWSSNCPEILKLLLISQACINGIFHIIQIRLLVVTSTNFLKILHS